MHVRKVCSHFEAFYNHFNNTGASGRCVLFTLISSFLVFITSMPELRDIARLHNRENIRKRNW